MMERDIALQDVISSCVDTAVQRSSELAPLSLVDGVKFQRIRQRLVVRVLLLFENKSRNKRVESIRFPCLDEGSNPSSSTLHTLNKSKARKVESDNRRNFNKLRRLCVYKLPWLGVHTDTAGTLRILPTGCNMATGKIGFVKL